MVKLIVQFPKKKSTTILGDSVADCSEKLIKKFKLDKEQKPSAAEDAAE